MNRPYSILKDSAPPGALIQHLNRLLRRLLRGVNKVVLYAVCYHRESTEQERTHRASVKTMSWTSQQF